MAVIALDWQHAGKPHAPRDRGAAYDQDGDGLISPHEHEVFFTGLDINYAAARLVGLGHTVYVLSDGSYAERAARAKKYGALVYVAFHRNAGRGSYGFVGYDRGTRPGKGGLSGAVLADHIATHLERAFPEALSEVKRVAVSGVGKWRRAHTTIKHVTDGIYANIVEPGFLDFGGHAEINSGAGAEKVGAAVGDGIHAALKGARLT